MPSVAEQLEKVLRTLDDPTLSPVKEAALRKQLGALEERAEAEAKAEEAAAKKKASKKKASEEGPDGGTAGK